MGYQGYTDEGDVVTELRSPRGFLLYYQGDPRFDRSVVTGENYSKWYSVFVVSVTGEITETRGDERMWQSSHIPHPGRVFQWAEKNGYAVDPKFMESMTDSYNLETDRSDNDEIAQIGPFAHRPHVYVKSPGFYGRRLEQSQPVNGYDLFPKDEVTVEAEDKSHEFVITKEIDLLKFLKSKKLWPES